jgi:hypothetical protein
MLWLCCQCAAACRSLARWSKWAREDLSDQGLPIIEIARTASEALPCRGIALSSANLKSAGRGSLIGGSDCPRCPQ